jgi:hypothetical protein
MEIVLLVAVLSILGLAVSSVAFAAAKRNTSPAVAPWPPIGPQPISRFFVRRTEVESAHLDPFDALLLRVERHVQLEQAAGESFVFAPTVESLHIKTVSPLGR